MRNSIMNNLLLTACCAMLFASGGALAADPMAGKEKAKVCTACHGPDGNSPVPDFPKLAGQHEDYLVKALNDYKSGARKNAIMAPLVANLSKRDITDLAAFYSQQKGLKLKY